MSGIASDALTIPGSAAAFATCSRASVTPDGRHEGLVGVDRVPAPACRAARPAGCARDRGGPARAARGCLGAAAGPRARPGHGSTDRGPVRATGLTGAARHRRRRLARGDVLGQRQPLDLDLEVGLGRGGAPGLLVGDHALLVPLDGALVERLHAVGVPALGDHLPELGRPARLLDAALDGQRADQHLHRGDEPRLVGPLHEPLGDDAAQDLPELLPDLALVVRRELRR